MHLYQLAAIGGLFLLCGDAIAQTTEPTTNPSASASAWHNPIVKKGYLNSPVCEVTPFVFNGKLYRLESWQKYMELPGTPAPGTRFPEDAVRVVDTETEKVVSVAMTNHGFASGFVWQNRFYVFSSSWGEGKPWRQAKQIDMTSTDDLIHWTPPVVAVRAEEGDTLYNVAVCRGKDSFVLLYETDNPKYIPFTFKYFSSPDLKIWTRVPDAFYGRDKYVGGPALYHEGDYYYTLYLQDLGGKWETRITRSTDLVNWQDAPDGRAFLQPNYSKDHLPLRPPELKEDNASDAELCEWKGKTFIYFTGGDQQYAADLQWAEYNGRPRELLEYFFQK